MKKIKVGDVVKWKCSPYGGKSFIAKGVVKKISVSQSGFINSSVQIEAIGQYKEIFPRRKTTTIQMYNLI